MSPTLIGQCSVCGLSLILRNDGTVSNHYDKDLTVWCVGTGKKPVSGTSQKLPPHQAGGSDLRVVQLLALSLC